MLLCAEFCCGCDDDGPRKLTGKSETVYCDEEDLIARGFVRSAPALLTCTRGPASKRTVTLRPAGWAAQKWQLNEWLLPVNEAQRGEAPGFLLCCVNGSYHLAALNEASQAC